MLVVHDLVRAIWQLTTSKLGIRNMATSQGPRKVFVIGVGMTKFEKPGRRPNFDYPEMAQEAVKKALDDAKVTYNDIQQATVGYVYGDSTCGQRALYEMGMTGIPIFNVNNNCSTGATALLLAQQMIRGGTADCVLALGFEKMERGSLTSKFMDRTNPMDKHVGVLANLEGIEAAPIAAQLFGAAGKEHMRKYGTKQEHFAKIAWKNHKHSTNNPYSQFQEEYTLEEILNSPPVYDPLTKLQCCPTSDGGAAAIVASEKFVKDHHLENQAVEIVGMEMATDTRSTFDDNSLMKLIGYDMTKRAADQLFRKSGYTPKDVQVVELHDCFSANELVTYEALGLAEEGKAAEMIDRGDNTYGGKYVVNPSGGLISKGHPLGATGLAQCAELCWQLRNQAGRRQVAGAKLALQHNIGLGGAVVVGLYKMGFGDNRIQLAARPAASGVTEKSFKVAEIFEKIGEGLKIDGETYVNKMKAIFLFKVKNTSGQEGIWLVDCKNGTGNVAFGETGPNKPDVTISMADEDLLNLMNGKVDPQRAFFQGKLKIAGNMGLALKLKEFAGQVGPESKL